MKGLVSLGVRHISMSGVSAGYIDMADCLNSVVGTGTTEGTGFGVTPRQVQITAALGTNGGNTLGVTIAKTANAALTYATSAKLMTNLGESEGSGQLSPQQKYLNWVLMVGTTPTAGGASDYVVIEAWG